MSQGPVRVISVLEYRDALGGTRGWGPWFFRPSRTSAVVLLLLVGVSVWMHFRHEPWALGLKIQGVGHRSLSLRCPGRLITEDGEPGIQIWDTVNYRLVRSIERSFDRMDLSPDGRQLFVVSWDRGLARWYELETGTVTKEVPIPAGDIDRISWTGKIILSGYGSRVLYDLLDVSKPDVMDRCTQIPFKPIDFSSDGRFVYGMFHVMFYDEQVDRAEVGLVGLMETSTHRVRMLPVTYPYIGGPRHVDGGKSLAVSHGLVLRELMAGPLEITDEEEISDTTGYHSRDLSSDGLMYAELIHHVENFGSVQFRNTRSGQVVSGDATVRGSFYRAVKFFPNSHRLFAPGEGWHTMAIYNAPSTKPSAIFNDESAVTRLVDIGADGRSIVTWGSDDCCRLWHKVGYECRESRFGVLGMPHVWLLGVLWIGLVVLLWRDGRRAGLNVLEAVPPWFVVVGILGAGAVGSFWMLLNFCLGVPGMGPWPILVLVGLGLATRGRGWRLVSLVVLTMGVPMLVLVGRQLRRVGLVETTPHFLFDRVWAVSHLWVGVGLVAAALFTVGAIVVLARQRSDVGG